VHYCGTPIQKKSLLRASSKYQVLRPEVPAKFSFILKGRERKKKNAPDR
jgi:hypothetical protein